jgi:predicted MFS family arabinose efflux permease
VVVGALTLGSGAPHLVRGLTDVSWQLTIVVTTVLAALAAVAISGVRTGPALPPSPPLDIRAAARALRHDRSLRLTTTGYLGHMRELYALWSWMAAFYVAARTRSTGTAPSVAETGVIVFLDIGVAGLGGAVIAGRFADHLGRTTITSAAMLLSAGCCLLSPIVFGASTPCWSRF